MQYKDYYKILNLERAATPDAIKKSYRKLARKYHPDVSKEPDAEERFKDINEAYEVLKDPERRSAYDQLGSNWKAGQEFRAPPGWQGRGFDQEGFSGFRTAGPFGAGEFSDFFDALFGRMRQGRYAHGRAAQMPGEDVHATLKISLEEAYQGGVRGIGLQTPEMDAQGRVSLKAKTINVRIPRGVTQDQQLRLRGQGGAGMGGGPQGDLYLKIEIAPHALFRLDGRDLYMKLPVAPWEAALGAKVIVPTLGGKIELSIPAGSQSGRKLRLRGKGMGEKSPGDLYIILRIVIPEPKTQAQQDLYRRMAEEMPFNPREGMGGTHG